MCGRFLLEPRDPQVVRSFFELEAEADLGARWNVAPTQEVPVVRQDEDGIRRVARLRWGLIPSWAKDAAVGQRMINARAETVAEKPSFRSAWKARRCIVPATGWYEWQAAAAGKQAWLLRRADAHFTPMAGLWESWQDPAGGRVLDTFTILTTEAVPELAAIHNRMPVVLEPSDFAAWIGAAALTAEDLERLCRPRPDRRWSQTAVSDRVNNARHDASDCALPQSAPDSAA